MNTELQGMQEQICALWLSAKTGIRPIVKNRLFDSFKSFQGIYEGQKKDFESIEGIRPSDIRALENKELKKAEDAFAYCGKNDISVLMIDSPEYPLRLKNIFDPPLVLFVKGKLPDIDANPVISVIGTRKADAYGLKISGDMAYEISLCGGTVVSGLTAGADAAAAEGALASGKPMVGVLGTSHDKCTSTLSRKVASQGALISEYPPGTEPNKSFFRARNRIAAGISVGVVVTQAPENSGTKLFASEAAEQGKDVFVVPGNVDSENSMGIYELMRDGAPPVIRGKEVLREYVSMFPDRIRLDAADNAERPEPSKKSRSASSPRKTASASSKPAQKHSPVQPPRNSSAERLAALPDRQRSAAECLKDGAKFVEEIMYITGIPVNELLSMLTLLEIKGIVKRNEDGRYILK